MFEDEDATEIWKLHDFFFFGFISGFIKGCNSLKWFEMKIVYLDDKFSRERRTWAHLRTTPLSHTTN